VEATCDAHTADWVASPGLDDIVQSDAWARIKAVELAKVA
jgi:hypothetical protein